MTTLTKRVEAALADYRPHSPRSVHRVIGGRPDRIAGALTELAATGVVTVKEQGGGRRLYTLKPRDEVTAIRRAGRLLAAVRQAGGSLARSDCYRPAGASHANDLDAVISRLVAEGKVFEDGAGRLVAREANLSPQAEVLLAGIRSRGVDGFSPDESDAALGGDDATPVLAELVQAGYVVVHGEGEHQWHVAAEHSRADPDESSPYWGIDDLVGLTLRRILTLGPQSEDAIIAAGARAGLTISPGRIELVADDYGLVRPDGVLWQLARNRTERQVAMCEITLKSPFGAASAPQQ